MQGYNPSDLKRKGRKPFAIRTKPVMIRMTQEEHRKLNKLGGSAWVRKMVEIHSKKE